MSTLEFNDALVNLEDYLKSFAYNYTRNRDDAEDLTQETMLKALKYRTQYMAQTNFKAWVFTIMRNLFLNQYRRKVKGGMIFDSSKELFLLNNPAENQDTPVNHMIGLDLEQQLNKLENEYKKPFELYVEGFKYQEIADDLKIPIGTVKSRIFIARKKLMNFLPDYKYLAN